MTKGNYLTINQLEQAYKGNLLGSLSYRQNPRGISMHNLFDTIMANNILNRLGYDFQLIKGIVANKTLNDDLSSLDIFTVYNDSAKIGNNALITLNYRDISRLVTEKSIVVPENNQIIPIALSDKDLLKFYSKEPSLDRTQWSNQNGTICLHLI